MPDVPGEKRLFLAVSPWNYQKSKGRDHVPVLLAGTLSYQSGLEGLAASAERAQSEQAQGWFTGKMTEKVVPPPSSLLTVIRP